MRRRLTTEDWIRRSIEFHGEKYDYSKSIYTRGDEKIIIICPDHGEQLQRAESHWKYGPRCCSGSKISSSKVSNASEFIEKARRKYGEKYDYSHVDYVNSHTDVIIVCPIHGMFEQRPANHINSKGIGGCLDCSLELKSKKLRMPIEIFIKKVSQIHNNNYDYSKVKYNNMNDNIEVICKEHNSFFPRASMHLYQKTGCPDCAYSGFNPNQPGYFYVHEIIDTQSNQCIFYKAGISGDWKRRLNDLLLTLPENLSIRNIS